MKSNKKSEKKRCELHLSLRHLMTLCRWAGFFPVTDIRTRIDGRMWLKFTSPYFYYYVTTIAIQIIMTCVTLVRFFTIDSTLGNLSSAVFYATSLSTALFLMRLSSNWSKLMNKAFETERKLSVIRVNMNATRSAVAISHAIMIMALVEHILSKLFNMRLVMICTEETSFNMQVIKHYYLHTMPYVFNHAFTVWSAVISEIASIQATFLWSFTDVLIICISIYLTSYFKDLNRMIYLQNKKYLSTWGQLRVFYSNLVILLKEIDSQLNFFIILSFFTNLFFICIQLFNTLRKNCFEWKFCSKGNDYSHIIGLDYLLYYMFSFIFLVTRALMISVLAANIHAEAIKPIAVLYQVPASEFSVEVNRFLLQLQYNTTGLSGLFFHVTKKMILRVFGTIMTYELVLLQFNSKSQHT